MIHEFLCPRKESRYILKSPRPRKTNRTQTERNKCTQVIIQSSTTRLIHPNYEILDAWMSPQELSGNISCAIFFVTWHRIFQIDNNFVDRYCQCMLNVPRLRG